MHIAVDIGGTQIRAALYRDNSSTPLIVEKISTQQAGTTPLERTRQAIQAVWPKDENVIGIGVAVPGPVDPHKGMLFKAPNIPGWINMPLGSLLEETFIVPVFLGNDANLAALGEWKYGAGQGHHDLIYLTVSTGIGGGVIIDDRLLLGASGLGAEVGHITIMPDGPMCGCGQRGHLEALASGPAIAKWVELELKKDIPSSLKGIIPLTAELVAKAAFEGDKLAIQALARAGEFIGLALADFLHLFNPSIVIIGGGVSRSGELLFASLRKSLEAHVLTSQYLENLVITTPQLGDEAGLTGALVYIRQQTANNK